ncbi:hypothetical protein O1A05_10950 [Citricoccus sp. NR2]|nr:hypothetical protein [Citricoccus sp. NR2]WBL18294.1 hypothetical protein O1A05_10950 [Citricoccus sp. NR2]
MRQHAVGGSDRHASASGDAAQRLASISSHPNLELRLVTNDAWSTVADSLFPRCLDAGPDAGALELSTELPELAAVREELRVSGVLARGEAVEDLHYDPSVNQVQ